MFLSYCFVQTKLMHWLAQWCWMALSGVAWPGVVNAFLRGCAALSLPSLSVCSTQVSQQLC